MTPKEKAIELVNEFLPHTNLKYCAEKCALIAVNEILKVTDDFEYNWWWEVKAEIEKM